MLYTEYINDFRTVTAIDNENDFFIHLHHFFKSHEKLKDLKKQQLVVVLIYKDYGMVRESAFQS